VDRVSQDTRGIRFGFRIVLGGIVLVVAIAVLVLAL
jgi:hypothetical protein